MKKKVCYFYMRLNEDQKELIRESAYKKNMNMTAYIWYLVTEDILKTEEKIEKD